MKPKKWLRILFILFVMNTTYKTVFAQQNQPMSELDKKVSAFLRSMSHRWHDLNVPESDGRLLYNLILKHHYTRAVEIGTSTGRSGIWLAWALSKTGGKLITIEMDEDRYREALANFKAAGLAQYIDARLANAHDLTSKLDGPFDFVFSDADKDWYTRYFQALAPKLEVGGCFTAHNVGMPGVNEYVDYVRSLPNYKTTIDTNGAGMAISFKMAEK